MEFAKPNSSNMHRTPSIDKSLIDVEDIVDPVLSKSDTIQKNNDVSKKTLSYDDIRSLENSQLNEILEFTRKNANKSSVNIPSSSEDSVNVSSESDELSPQINEAYLSNELIKLIERIYETEEKKIQIQQEHIDNIERYMDLYFDNIRTDRVFWFLLLILSHIAVYIMFFKI